jgi:hypothetical protein
VSLLSKFKKAVGSVRLSDFDPTSSKSKFGGIVAQAVKYVPVAGAGISTAIDAKKTVGGLVRVGEKKPAAATPVSTPTAANTLPDQKIDVVQPSKAPLYIGLAAAAVVVLFVVTR